MRSVLLHRGYRIVIAAKETRPMAPVIVCAVGVAGFMHIVVNAERASVSRIAARRIDVVMAGGG